MNFKNMLLTSKRRIVIAIVLVIIIAFGSFYTVRHNAPVQQTNLPPVKASGNVIAEGKVIPVNYSVLSFPVSGIVSEVLVHEGDKVKAGQVLVRLENKDLQAKYQSALAELIKVQAKYKSAVNGLRPEEIKMKEAVMAQRIATCEEAKANFERSKRLFEQSAISEQQLDKERTAYLKAKADLEQAAADTEMAKLGSRAEEITAAEADAAAATAKVQELAANIAQTELKAPFSGVIASIDLKPGEFVTTETAKYDENAEVTDSIKVQLADLSKWQIKTNDLTEINVAKIKEGAQVKITFDALPGLELSGTVKRIREYGEKKRGDMTYAVFIEPLETDQRLRWNMTASVSIDSNDGK